MQLRSFLTLIALCFCVGLFAQTTAERAAERAKNRTERKAQNKVDNKVDKAVDDTFKAVGNLFKKKDKKTTPPAGTVEPANPATKADSPTTETPDNSEAEAMEAINNALGGGSDEPYEGYTNPVTFSMDMEITETKKNGKVETNTISMAVTTNNFAIVINDPESKNTSQMIFNTEDGKTTMITTDKNGKKSGFRMKMPGARNYMADAMEEVDDRFTYTQTGERRTIDGYDCEKVIVKDTKEGTTTESWITQDLGIESKDVFSGFMGALGGKNKMGKGNIMDRPFDGFPIMSTTVDNGKTFVTHFMNIKIGEDKYDSSLLDTSGVEIQSLGF